MLYILLSALYIWAGTISVNGRVHSDDEKPLRSAEVILFGIQDPVSKTLIEQTGNTTPVPVARALTDEAGKFTLQAPSHGLWMIQIRAPGYIGLEMLLSPLLDDFEVPSVKMIRDSGLTIRVTSPSGTPVPDALVIADDEREPSYWDENPWLPSRRAGLTSAEGVLRLSAGAKENLTVSVNAKGFAFLEKKEVHAPSVSLRLLSGTQSTLEIFGTNDRPISGAAVQLGDSNCPLGLTDEAGGIDINANPNSKIPFQVTTRDQRKYEGEFQTKTDPSKPVRIILKDSLLLNGRVINRENQVPVDGSLVWTSDARWNVVTSAQDGTFSLKLPNASNNLRSAAPGFTIYQNYDRQPRGNRGIFTIALQPEAQLLGTVLNQHNQPITGAEVQLQSRFTYRFIGAELNQKQTTNENGNFRFTNLNPERVHFLTIRAKGYARVERQENISTATKKQIKIVLSPEINVSGKVVDIEDHPLSQIPLSLKPSVVEMSGDEMVYSISKTKKIEGQTEQNGIFQIGELHPGKYDLEVGGKGYSTYQKIGLEIPETQKPIDLGKIILAPAIALEGRVLDKNKQPVEDAQIHLRPNDPYSDFDGEDDPAAVSGVDGYFSVPDQTTGNVIDLLVKHTGFVDKKLQEFPLPPAEPLTIILEPASKVSGIVVDSSGQPVAEASLRLFKRVVRGTRSMSTDSHSATSKTDGRFEFLDIPPERYVLTVSASGWQDYEMEGVELSPGKDVNDLRVTLAPESFVEGTVMMSDGQPAIGARVKTASEETQRWRPGISQAWTDGSGNYILHGLKQGKAMIEATHQEAPRQVKETDLKPGSNRLDFQLEGGYSVSGRVQDESGAGLANVSLSIYVANVTRLSATSLGDGTFQFKSVPNGNHNVEVIKEGYTVSEKIKVQVNNAPVEGFTITMKKGVVIQGQISGLPPEKLSLVYIEGYSESTGLWVTTKPDYKSEYVLRGVVPGQWQVSASLTGSGASVTKTISVEQSDVHLDLEFSRGLVLDGAVLSDDLPVSNATVVATGKETDSYTYATTRADGTFHIEGLTKGGYKLRVSNWQEGWEHQEEIDLQEDKKITIQLPSNRITGAVFDAQDRSPIAGVTVSLLAAGTNPNTTSNGGAVTDSSGHFVVKNVTPGNWMLAAKKEGYAAQNQAITIEESQDISGIEFLLRSSGGITLEIRNSFGIFMDSITIAVLNSASQILSVANYSSQGYGRFRISTVPPGTWELILLDYNSAQTSVMVSVPQQEPVRITLQPASKLKVKVPALSSDQSIAKMTLTGSDGRPYRSLRSWTGTLFTEIEVYSGEALMEMLPAGTWNILIVATDGRQWQKSVTTSAGTITEVVLE